MYNKNNLPASLDWQDWKSQLKHTINTVEDLRQWINVSDEEEKHINQVAQKYRWGTTPYYVSLMDPDDEICPVRQQGIPSIREFQNYTNSSIDPVDDTGYRVTNRLIHKYRDRGVILVTEQCSMYCRHCFRKAHTMDHDSTYFRESDAVPWDEDFEYITNHPEIRDILLTGGDPLMYSDEKLEYILSRLRQIPHLEILRIGSRMPTVLPMRITPQLCKMLEKYAPIYVNTQFNHPKELTEEAAAAADLLLRHGIIMQNQSVLLKGINDDVQTMRALVTGLLKIRVRPYYLYHCDNAIGVSHFTTSIEKGRDVMRGVYGHVTGFAVPQYILTTPLGKIPAMEAYLFYEDGKYWVVNHKGEKMNVSESLLVPDSEIK